MPHFTSIALDDQCAAFVKRQVELGKYRSVSEAIRAALQILEERELQYDALRTAFIEGESSGPAEPLDLEVFLAAKRVEWSE